MQESEEDSAPCWKRIGPFGWKGAVESWYCCWNEFVSDDELAVVEEAEFRFGLKTVGPLMGRSRFVGWALRRRLWEGRRESEGGSGVCGWARESVEGDESADADGGRRRVGDDIEAWRSEGVMKLVKPARRLGRGSFGLLVRRAA